MVKYLILNTTIQFSKLCTQTFKLNDLVLLLNILPIYHHLSIVQYFAYSCLSTTHRVASLYFLAMVIITVSD